MIPKRKDLEKAADRIDKYGLGGWVFIVGCALIAVLLWQLIVSNNRASAIAESNVKVNQSVAEALQSVINRADANTIAVKVIADFAKDNKEDVQKVLSLIEKHNNRRKGLEDE